VRTWEDVSKAVRLKPGRNLTYKAGLSEVITVHTPAVRNENINGTIHEYVGCSWPQRRRNKCAKVVSSSPSNKPAVFKIQTTSTYNI
jgi:hypothetical protein